MQRSRPSTIVLEGGLGNRMRVAAAAAAMQERTGIAQRVLWLEQWGMRCRFDSLFQPADGLELRDAIGSERWLYTRSRAANLWLPQLAQRALYRHVIRSESVLPLVRQNFDFEAWFRQGSTLMLSYRDFCDWTPVTLARLFRPCSHLAERIDERCAAFSAHTIGVHIRRTDSVRSIAESPTEMFTEAIDRELELRPDTLVYVATDDQPTKQALLLRYGSHRIITPAAEATRESTEGIQDALIEMYTLARTQRIYGSAGSTFSWIAARLGGIELTVLSNLGRPELTVG